MHTWRSFHAACMSLSDALACCAVSPVQRVGSKFAKVTPLIDYGGERAWVGSYGRTDVDAGTQIQHS